MKITYEHINRKEKLYCGFFESLECNSEEKRKIKILREMQHYPCNISFNVNKAIKVSEDRNYSSSEVSICFLVVWCFLCSADAKPQGGEKPQQLQFTINASVVPNILVSNQPKLHHYTTVHSIPLLNG